MRRGKQGKNTTKQEAENRDGWDFPTIVDPYFWKRLKNDDDHWQNVSDH